MVVRNLGSQTQADWCEAPGIIRFIYYSCVKNQHVAAVGFEPTPPRRLVPKTSALDRSATLPASNQRLEMYLPTPSVDLNCHC